MPLNIDAIIKKVEEMEIPSELKNLAEQLLALQSKATTIEGVLGTLVTKMESESYPAAYINAANTIKALATAIKTAE